jgi:membrane associated rhomboid family serine protease
MIIMRYSMRTNYVFNSIIATNCGIFIAWKISESNPHQLRFMIDNFTCSKYNLEKKHYYHTAITSIFSHRDFWHFFSNMFTFYFFGRNLVYVISPGIIRHDLITMLISFRFYKDILLRYTLVVEYFR